MNRRFQALIVLTFITVSCLSAGTVREAAAMDREIIYTDHIDRMILRCENKKWMSDSGSKAVRAESAIRMLKGSFLKANKSDLVQDMIAEDLGTKPHQMSYYLNKRFFTYLRRSADYCERRGTVNTGN